ncbi:hypothetical protein MJ571_27345 [Klebsiella pneumoniae]|nr:hypothetical protein MJ571_27345 [Klebsiella pneumoniae]
MKTPRFVALQNSRNGESLLAGEYGGRRQNGSWRQSLTWGWWKLAGDDRPWNPGAMTGGLNRRRWLRYRRPG